MIIKVAIIKKLPNGRYRLYSRKKDKSGKRRNLGTFDSLEAAKKRERAVQFFKYHADDQNSRDKETKALSLLSDIASYLEQAGYTKHAQDVYNVMDSIDSNLDNADDMIPDAQRNVENMGVLSDTGISSGFFGIQEAEKLANLANKFDKLGLFNEADRIDSLLIKFAGRYIRVDNKEGKQIGGVMNAALMGQQEGKSHAAYYIPYGTEVSVFIDNYKTEDEAINAIVIKRRESRLKSKNEMKTDDFDFKIAKTVKSIKQDYKDGLFDKMPVDNALSLLAKRLNMNINNSQEGGFIAGLAVAMGFLHPQEAFGNPEAYQSALIIFENPDSVEMDNLDALVRSNGLQGTTVIDNQNSGMFQGLSDAYFYQNYQNLDHRYKIAP